MRRGVALMLVLKRRVILCAAAIVFFAVLPLGHFLFGWFDDSPGAAGEKLKAELAAAYEQLGPLPGAVLTGREELIEGGKGSMAYTFTTRRSNSEVILHYNMKLKDNGWRYADTWAVREWGRDTGMRNIVYQRGEFTAAISYRRDNPGDTVFGLTFAKQ
jgi:hypothetical protein